MTHNSRLLTKVAEIYSRLDLQIDSSDLVKPCRLCGKCCNFTEFDHRLFVTAPEIAYFAANLNGDKPKSMTTGVCPYNVDGNCEVYENRFAGCRIFCCKGDADFQSSLSESVLEEFKSLCTEFQIPYLYTDLATALNNF